MMTTRAKQPTSSPHQAATLTGTFHRSNHPVHLFSWYFDKATILSPMEIADDVAAGMLIVNQPFPKTLGEEVRE